MTSCNLCAPFKGAHTFLLLVATLLFSSISLAHPVVFSEYSLKHENDQWLLSFEQKTSYLRDAIYDLSPDLKGINLNSDVFLKATSAYISSILTLTYNGKEIHIEPQQMNYGGLRFVSTFLVEGLPSEPGHLTIKTDGFDTHEHSIIVFRVEVEKEGYLNYFNRDQRLATYNFATHHFDFGEIKNDGKFKLIPTVIAILIIIGIAIKLFLTRRTHQLS